VRCGLITCPEGQYCCNESCSLCRHPGDSCPDIECGELYGPDPDTLCEPTECVSLHYPVEILWCDGSVGKEEPMWCTRREDGSCGWNYYAYCP
jgi:hypothetical protein